MNQTPTDDPMLKLLTSFFALRQGGSESTIQEHEQISLRTRAALPLAHAALVIASFVMIVGGLMLAGVSVARVFGWHLEPGQALLAGVALAFLLLVVWEALPRVLSIGAGAPRMFFILFLVAFLGVAALNAAASLEPTFGWGEMAGLVLGAALALGGVALGYNQALSLLEPYWRQSPFERTVMRMLPALFGLSSPPPAVEERRATDYTLRINGQHVAGPPPVAEPARVTIDPEQGNDIWFALYAVGMRDLSYRTLAMQPAPLLPFEERDRMGRPRRLRLRERTIRRLLERGARRGWWEAPGPGQVAQFLMKRSEVRADALRMWREVMGDAPAPDYWAGRDYVTSRPSDATPSRHDGTPVGGIDSVGGGARG